MKKIYSYLHNPDVQGYLIIGIIFTAVALATVLTWGK
jgi:hypothetical protein